MLRVVLIFFGILFSHILCFYTPICKLHAALEPELYIFFSILLSQKISSFAALILLSRMKINHRIHTWYIKNLKQMVLLKVPENKTLGLNSNFDQNSTRTKMLNFLSCQMCAYISWLKCYYFFIFLPALCSVNVFYYYYYYY